MFVASLWCVFIWSVEAAVLDPALYLSPSPPLTDTADTHSFIPALFQPRAVDIKTLSDTSDPVIGGIGERPTSRREPQPMERAKLFWPRSQPPTPQLTLGSIQVPLSFGLSGTYGNYPGNGMGIIGSSYATVADAGAAAGSALAGSSYGNYGAAPGSVRIYGRGSVPTWSGWGNGKWGHYGKG